MGIDVKDCGCRICQKGGGFDQKGGIQSSKGTGLQDNHGHWNRPKSLRVMQPICWNGILATHGPERRSGGK